MGKTSIEWTDASWNPIVGCTEISPGCAHCYAARLAATRLRNTPQYKGLTFFTGREKPTPPHWTGQVRFLPERLEEPLHWRKPRRIFVCDMGDLFHEQVDIIWIDEIFRVIERTPHHTYQILTKRAQNMNAYMLARAPGAREMLPNVWLGVSVENQRFADERIPLLLQTPAAVRWISAEPLLGPVNLMGPSIPYTKLDWIVCGGESGPNARPMHPEWARSLRDQCKRAGVPFFFKQWGEWSFDEKWYRKLASHRIGFCGQEIMFRVGKKKAGRLLDGREWNEFPT